MCYPELDQIHNCLVAKLKKRNADIVHQDKMHMLQAF